MSRTFQCQRCGYCCLHVGSSLQATAKDIERWQEERRRDILKHVDMALGDIWLDGKGDQLGYCPFLVREEEDRYGCEIYETRPEQCQKYPFFEIRDGSVVHINDYSLEHCPATQKYLTQEEIAHLRATKEERQPKEDEEARKAYFEAMEKIMREDTFLSE